MDETSAAEGRAGRGEQRGNSVSAQVARMHKAIWLFYACDAAFLTAYGWIGTVWIHLGWIYASGGIGVSVLVYRLLRSGVRTAGGQSRINLAQTTWSSLVMLTTLALAPQVGGLMLMTLMAVVSASALQMRTRPLLLMCGLLGAAVSAVIAFIDQPLQLPSTGWAERVVTGLWAAWLLAKAGLTHVAATELRQLVTQANAKLQAALIELEQVAARDELTVLPNRRSIMAQLQVALEAHARARTGFVGVALLDIDHFKSVNDRFGHAIGDEVLRVFAQRVSSCLRPTDTVGRYGGEEFLMVLQQVRDESAARDAAERVRNAVAGHDWQRLAPGLAVTASVGVALVQAEEPGSAAIQRADEALYAAKGRGRNCVVFGAGATAPAGRGGAGAAVAGAIARELADRP